MKRFVACTLLVVSSVVGFARTASAETAVRIMTDEDGYTWQMDIDSRYTYITNHGVRQVDFNLSTSNDVQWHAATVSCGPYDIASNYYGWNWSGTDNLPSGTVGGSVAGAACYY